MRRAVAAAAAAILGIWLAARYTPKRIANRVEVIRKTHAWEPGRRRIAGTSAAADRAFYLFLANARRALPPSARGVALYAPGKTGSELYLAAYEFAPLPVRVAPREVPDGWTAAVYGAVPEGWRVVRELPGGAFASPRLAP